MRRARTAGFFKVEAGKSQRSYWCWAAIGLGMAGRLEAEPLVFARSVVNKDYEAARAGRGQKPETYVFYQGKFFEGQVVDRTLERMRFVEISRSLAPYLLEQRYIPAATMAEADLILVVHWGVTIGRNQADALVSYNTDTQTKLVGAGTDYATALEAQIAGGDPGTMPVLMEAERRMNDLSVLQSAEAGFARIDDDLSSTSNASLLGFADVIRDENRATFTSTTMATIHAMLDEDRYFVIVMAYDRRALVNDKVARRVWSIRLSMRSAGVNFREALSYLGGIGGELFGTKSEKMLIRKARPKEDQAKRGNVSVGELKVIESGAAKP